MLAKAVDPLHISSFFICSTTVFIEVNMGSTGDAVLKKGRSGGTQRPVAPDVVGRCFKVCSMMAEMQVRSLCDISVE